MELFIILVGNADDWEKFVKKKWFFLSNSITDGSFFSYEPLPSYQTQSESFNDETLSSSCIRTLKWYTIQLDFDWFKDPIPHRVYQSIVDVIHFLCIVFWMITDIDKLKKLSRFNEFISSCWVCGKKNCFAYSGKMIWLYPVQVVSMRFRAQSWIWKFLLLVPFYCYFSSSHSNFRCIFLSFSLSRTLSIFLSLSSVFFFSLSAFIVQFHLIPSSIVRVMYILIYLSFSLSICFSLFRARDWY